MNRVKGEKREWFRRCKMTGGLSFRRMKCVVLLLVMISATVFGPANMSGVFRSIIPGPSFGAAVQQMPGVSGQTHAPVASETLEAISRLNEEELSILSELFDTVSKMDQIEAELADLQAKILQLQADLRVKQGQIESQEAFYSQVKRTLAQVLRSQQRAGVASNLVMVLRSTGLKDLLRRLNLLRELSRKTDDLMLQAEAARAALQSEQAAMAALLLLQKKQEQALMDTQEALAKAQADLEAQLSALKEDRASYEHKLLALNQAWTAFKPVFTRTVTVLSEMIETGNVPEGTLEVEFSLLQAKGRIRESRFNEIARLRAELPDLLFNFEQEGVAMNFIKERATLNGRFVLTSPKSLSFAITSGTFQGVDMSRQALEDLVVNGTLVFDLTGALGNGTLRQVNHGEDYIELLIQLNLF